MICCDICGSVNLRPIAHGFYWCGSCHNRVVQAPTLETIREALAIIRTRWTAAEEEQRRLGHRQIPWEVEIAFHVSDHLVRRKANKVV